MSNITKNLLLGLTLVCVIVLIVFSIQLIVINSGVERANPGSISGGSQNNGNGDEQPGGENGDGESGETPDEPTTRPPPQGLRHEIMLSDNNRLLIYAREEFFSFEEGDLNWWFNFTGGGTATLEIAFTMITTAQGAAAHAESFLNRYSEGTEATFTGEEAIKGSNIRGHHAIARHGGTTYEVWLHNLDDSDIALAFVINYENDQQKEALYEVLSTMDLIRMGDVVVPPSDFGDAGDGTGIGTGIADGDEPDYNDNGDGDGD